MTSAIPADDTRLVYDKTPTLQFPSAYLVQCDGVRPSCGQCRLTGRECAGYLQDLVVFHHKPTIRCPKKRKKMTDAKLVPEECSLRSRKNLPMSDTGLDRNLKCIPQQHTYDECVAILIQHYIPKDEVPFVGQIAPSKSRICGGWVQALPHVSKGDADFERIVSPAVHALTMAMLVTGTDRQQKYIDTYGHALQGIRSALDGNVDPVGSTVAIAGMCLALSEVLVPTSNEGYKAHLRGVAAMVQSRGPEAFTDGAAHLMFVGVRPLIVLDALLRCRTTFLMDEDWRTVPFSMHLASPMQILLSHAASVSHLLEKTEGQDSDSQSSQADFKEILSTIEDWETSFLRAGTPYQYIDPDNMNLPINPRLLPNPCFSFNDVSHANALTHCWAFRTICLLQLSKPDQQPTPDDSTQLKDERRASLSNLCTMICQGLPYLLQVEMSLYGSMSAGFPLHTVCKSLQALQLPRSGDLVRWCSTIKELMGLQRIALYEDMAESGAG